MVEFKPKSTAMAAFRTLIDEDAQMLREREPRHVAFAPPGPYPRADDRILLSEIYDSRVAFSTHLQSSYFAAFDKTGAD